MLIIVGLSLLAQSTTDSRGDLVDQYNSAVAAWTGTERAAFAMLSFSLLGISGSPSFKQMTTPDTGGYEEGSWIRFPKDDDNGAGLNSYTPLKYVAMFNRAAEQYAKVSYNCTGCSAQKQTMPKYGAPKWTSSAFAKMSYSACTNKGGAPSYSDGRGRRRSSESIECRYPVYVSQICQALERGAGWQNTKEAKGGCSYQSGGFTYYGYKTTPSAVVSAVVRSAADPYLKALSLTKGTLNFGATQGQKASTGVWCLVIGCIFMIPCCCLLYFLHKKQQQKHNAGGSVILAPAYGHHNHQGYPGHPHPQQQYPGQPHPQQQYPQQPHGMKPPGQETGYTQQAAPPVYTPDAHQGAAVSQGSNQYPQGNYQHQGSAPPQTGGVAAALPPGWQAASDPAGRTYYYNGNETTWSHPSAQHTPYV
jgi:hypothetical protein